MRLTRLHLIAYGHFTDRVLDFGAEPGFHLIYGDNEAGKSTTLRALSSVLFGYPHEVVDGFKHDAKDIAIGADIRARDGRSLAFVRKRRGKAALGRPDGSTIEEGAVKELLGDVSRDVFEKVFALNHLRLREHARGLLAEGGSLGFSLAEAGSGIAGLKAVLDRLRATRSALFLATGSRPALNQQIGRLNELRKEARRRTVSPSQYKKSQNEIDEIEAEFQAKRERQKVLAAGTRRLERIAKNLPLRAEHQELSRKIAELENIPLLPDEFTEHRVKLQTEHDAAVETDVTESRAIAELQNKIAGIVLDESILQRRQDIERVASERPVIANVERDIPKREAERNQYYARARATLTEAELAGDPADLAAVLPSRLKRTAIATLADAGTKLMARLSAATEGAQAAGRNLKKAEDQLAQIKKPPDAGDLSRTLDTVNRLGDITAEISKRQRGLERRKRTVTETIVGLGIKSGSASALREMVVPAENTVTRYAEELAKLDKEVASVRDVLHQHEGDIANLTRKVEALERSGKIATEEDLNMARGKREQGWALVRGLYIDGRKELADAAKAFAADRTLAESYEWRVGEADRIADVIRAHAEGSTELSLLRRQKAETEANMTAEGQRLALLASQRDILVAQWRALWPAEFSLPHLPGEMREWMARRKTILGDADTLEEEAETIEELAGKERLALDSLTSGLADFPGAFPEDGLDGLLERGRTVLENVRRDNTVYVKANESVRTQSENKEQANAALAKLERDIAAWTQKWGEALGATGLRSDLTIESANVVLKNMQELDALKSKIDDLTHRITEMTQDRGAFGQSIAGLEIVEPGAVDSDPVGYCLRLEARLDAARTAEAELLRLKSQLTDHVSKRDQAREVILHTKSKLGELCKQADCMDPQELAEIGRKSANKKKAIEDREGIEKRVRADGAGFDLESLFAECDGAAGDQIPGDIARLKAEGEVLDQAIEQMMKERATRQAAFDQLVTQDQAADLTQEAANVEAELAGMVDTYVDLTVQEALLREAIEIYRERNQGPILKRANGLFAELTDDAYKGLRADVDDKNEPILLAEHHMRGSLGLEALTDGTVDPLYLALRLAAIEEHNATREPLPFIADDLLLNFDNTRSQAALRTLARIAASNQVLFFTHHAHMVDLARAAVPEGVLSVHRLSEAAA